MPRVLHFTTRYLAAVMSITDAERSIYKALQTDKVKLSRLLHSQKPRQLAFAAELQR